MIAVLAGIVIGLGLVGTGWGITTLALNKPVGRAQLIANVVLELATLTQSVIAFVLLAQGYRPAEFGTTVGYLIAAVIVVPLGVAWAISDRSRFAGGVLAVAGFAVLAMTLRLLQLWSGA
jgi:hypothetical protein